MEVSITHSPNMSEEHHSHPTSEEFVAATNQSQSSEELGWELYALTKYIQHISYKMSTYCYRDQRKEYFIPTTREEFAQVDEWLSNLVKNATQAQEKIRKFGDAQIHLTNVVNESVGD
jgi:hypothetical protein